MVLTSYNRFTNLLIKGFFVLFIILVALPVRMINHLIQLKDKSKVMAIFIFMLLTIGGHIATAQGFKKFVNNYQIGLEGSYGIKAFTISSNISEINNLQVIGEGGTIGVVWGSKAVVMKLRQGYFYSASKVAYTVDEVKSAAIVNFYPLNFINPDARFRPYVMASVERDVLQMFGYYDHTKDQQQANYSTSEAPYLGKISAIQAGFGGGLEYRVKTPGHFVALFGEARYTKSIRSVSSNELFAGTTTPGQLSVNVGVAFGYNQ